MTDKKNSQLNLIGTLFLVLGLLSIFNLPILSQVGEQLKENSVVTANLTTLDGANNAGGDQFDSILRSMLIGMLIGTVVFSLVCFLTGICILKRISHRSCLIGAVVVLIAFPLGTILGICSLILLRDVESRQLFGGQQIG
ncbi:MAG: hypothetical protein ABIK07_02360 [Planctomycetota bacterium]